MDWPTIMLVVIALVVSNLALLRATQLRRESQDETRDESSPMYDGSGRRRVTLPPTVAPLIPEPPKRHKWRRKPEDWRCAECGRDIMDNVHIHAKIVWEDEA